jgi:hypothetical protein
MNSFEIFTEIVAGFAALNKAGKIRELNKGKIALANAACEYWKSIYPVEHDDRAHPPRPPGTGRDSIHVVVRHGGDSVAVVCDDPIGHIIEWGSVNSPEFACRARTEEYFNHAGGQDRLKT